MFHKKGERDPSPIRDRNHTHNAGILDSSSNQFHIHGGQDAGFVVAGGPTSTLGNTGLSHTGVSSHSGLGSHSGVGSHVHQSSLPVSHGTGVTQTHHVEGLDRRYAEAQPHAGDMFKNNESIGGHIHSGSTQFVETRPVDVHHTTSGYSTSHLSGSGHVENIHSSHVSHSSMSTTQSHTGGAGVGGAITKIKENLTPQNLEKVLNTTEKIIHKGQELAAKLPQPKDVHVDHDKLGRPIEKTGEAYTKVAAQIVHTLHQGAHKVDEKLGAMDERLHNPGVMGKHHERAMKVGETIQNALNKAQGFIDKVQDVTEKLEGKAREKGISPTRVREQAKQHIHDMAQGKEAPPGQQLKAAVHNLSNKVESSQHSSGSAFNKENVMPVMPSGLSSGMPMKVETVIETKVTELSNKPGVPGQGIHMSNLLGPKQF